jgi:hypothetical protein
MKTHEIVASSVVEMARVPPHSRRLTMGEHFDAVEDVLEPGLRPQRGAARLWLVLDRRLRMG